MREQEDNAVNYRARVSLACQSLLDWILILVRVPQWSYNHLLCLEKWTSPKSHFEISLNQELEENEFHFFFKWAISVSLGSYQLRVFSHLRVWSMIQNKVHVCLHWSSLSFTLQCRGRTRDFCLRHWSPVVITYMGCVYLYLTLIGL